MRIPIPEQMLARRQVAEMDPTMTAGEAAQGVAEDLGSNAFGMVGALVQGTPERLMAKAARRNPSWSSLERLGSDRQGLGGKIAPNEVSHLRLIKDVGLPKVHPQHGNRLAWEDLVRGHQSEANKRLAGAQTGQPLDLPVYRGGASEGKVARGTFYSARPGTAISYGAQAQDELPLKVQGRELRRAAARDRAAETPGVGWTRQYEMRAKNPLVIYRWAMEPKDFIEGLRKDVQIALGERRHGESIDEGLRNLAQEYGTTPERLIVLVERYEKSMRVHPDRYLPADKALARWAREEGRDAIVFPHSQYVVSLEDTSAAPLPDRSLNRLTRQK